MAYACNCGGVSGYSGFFDELTKIFNVALPVVGAVRGATSGYEEGGVIQGVTGAMTGYAQGYQATQPTVVPQQQILPAQYQGQPQDSLLGTGMYQWVPSPGVAPINQGTGTPQPQIYYAGTSTAYQQQLADQATARNKLLLYGGIGLGGLVLLILVLK